MPRKSNQTEYDNMMSVFKQHGQHGNTRSSSSRHTHGHAPAQAIEQPQSQVPRPHTPRPPHVPSSAASAYPGYPVPLQSQTGGLVSPQGWEEHHGGSSSTLFGVNPPDTRYTNPTYDVTPSYGSSSANMPSATTAQVAYPSSSTRWIVQFHFEGQPPQRLDLPIQRHLVPELQCPCGAHIRIVHLPTLVDWTPPFGVLWNFGKGTYNVWREGRVQPNTYISAVKCPGCHVNITLSGPHIGATT